MSCFKYSVSIEERFKGGPQAGYEDVNMSVSMIFSCIEDVANFVNHDVQSIYETRNVLKETTIIEKHRLTKKILFERVGRHGRLLRIYTVIPNRKQIQEINDLI